VSFIAFIYSLLIIVQTRRILSRPWAFVYIVIRLGFALLLRSALVLKIPLDAHIPEMVKAIAALLDLMTIREIHLAYNELFPESFK